MEIKLNYSKKEWKHILDGLNNAIIALHSVYSAGRLGCAVPKEFEKFFDKPYEEIDKICDKRMDAILQLYCNIQSLVE